MSFLSCYAISWNICLGIKYWQVLYKNALQYREYYVSYFFMSKQTWTGGMGCHESWWLRFVGQIYGGGVCGGVCRLMRMAECADFSAWTRPECSVLRWVGVVVTGVVSAGDAKCVSVGRIHKDEGSSKCKQLVFLFLCRFWISFNTFQCCELDISCLLKTLPFGYAQKCARRFKSPFNTFTVNPDFTRHARIYPYSVCLAFLFVPSVNMFMLHVFWICIDCVGC